MNWLFIEERIDFAPMKLVLNGLNNKNIPENLQLKLSKEKQSLRKNSVMLVHQNKNIKPAYLEETNKVFNDLQMKYEKTFVRYRFQCSKTS